jgi:HSP20 family molecular chaperone IbpA
MTQTTQPQVVQDRPQVAPVVDVKEDGEGYTLTANLPGVPEGAVQLTVEDRTLMLDAENDVAAPEGYTVLRREIPALHYRAVFELPDRVDVGAVKSTLRNGVLTVVLPKREEVKPRRVPVVTG